MVYICLTDKINKSNRDKIFLNLVGHSDLVNLSGKFITQRIKGTPGITGL